MCKKVYLKAKEAEMLWGLDKQLADAKERMHNAIDEM